MTEQNIVDGLIVQLRATNGFEQGNTGTAVADDERVLAAGVDRAAVVYSNEFAQKRMVTGGLMEMTYTLDVALFIRHNNDIVAARQDARLYTQNIVQRINTNKTLGGSAFDAVVTAGRVEDEAFEIGGLAFLLRSLTVSATEHLSTR